MNVEKNVRKSVVGFGTNFRAPLQLERNSCLLDFVNMFENAVEVWALLFEYTVSALGSQGRESMYTPCTLACTATWPKVNQKPSG